MTITNPRSVFPAVLGVLVAALLVQNFVGTSSNGGPGEFAFILAINLVLGGWLFLRAIPQAIEAGPQKAARRALVMAVIAFVGIGVFWSGLPFTLGPAAVVLGVLSRQRGAGGLAVAATVLGVLALLGGIAITIGDQITG